jgi:phosphohistidine phosphatase
MKRLILMRHAKSDWDADYESDHDRPLNDRGQRAADTMGKVLAHAGVVPELAITSSALRARTTVERAASAGAWPTRIEVTEQLYGTSPVGAIAVAADASDRHETVMLVGHEPTWSGLVHHLTGASVQIKTATVVAIDLRIVHWRSLPVTGEIAFVLQPRLFTAEPWAPVLE